MKIIICGGGQVGSAICESLWQTCNIILIDKDEAIVDELYSKYDIQGIVGSGTSVKVMEEAGINTADFFLAVTSSDESNIISSIMAQNYGVPHVYGRVRNPEYLEDVAFMEQAMGMSRMINPEMDAAHLIRQILTFPTANSIEEFAHGNIQIIGLTVKEGSLIDGRSLDEFRNLFKNPILVCMVKRGNQVTIPDGSFRVEAGDEIHVTAARHHLKELYDVMRVNKRTAQRIMIIGGGQITYYLLESLAKHRKQIKVIESDWSRCQELALKFPNVDVIHGDNTDQKLLDAEGIDKYDAVVSLNEIDEENMIVSLYAKSRDVDKVITKINRPYLLKPLSYLGLDTIVTPKQLIAEKIIRLTRSLKATQNSSVINLYKLVDEENDEDDVEALEFEVLKASAITGRSLKDLRFLPGTLIIGIYRDDTFLLPSGSDQIQVGDRVTVITRHPNISDINQLLQEPA